MPKVVSNTTPLLSLLKINQLDLLKHLYGCIYIPEAVYKEIEAGKNKKFYQDLSKIEWIKIVKIRDQKALKYFLDLDSGEAEAIVLATELMADLIIIDEKLGRFHAKHAELKITGTIGVLLKAKSEGLIDRIKPLLNELIEMDIWISDKLKNEILEIAREI
jgi:predicted nucleic acid-binding protein